MSSVYARVALETAVAAMTPTLHHSVRERRIHPVVGTPYQRVNILFAEPDNTEISASYQERGILQVTLFYPAKAGTARQPRAELIRSTFYRGRSLTAVDGVTVTIDRTPRNRSRDESSRLVRDPCARPLLGARHRHPLAPSRSERPVSGHPFLRINRRP
jgi:hypothetical protein